MSVVAASIDQREPKHLQRLTFGGVPVDVSLLPTGDFILVAEDGSLIGVERKQVSDFLNTLKDDRLFRQLTQLKQLTPFAYLALVGDMRPARDGGTYVEGMHRDWKWASVQGALLTAQEIGVHILWVPDDDELEAALVRLCNRSRGPVRVEPIRETVMVSEGEAVVAALPGIGPEKAATLLAECGDAATALMYLTTPDREWEGVEVAGVKDGTKRKVRKALGLSDDQHLRVELLPVRSERGKE